MGIRENLLAGKPRIVEKEVAGVEGRVRLRAMLYGDFKKLLEDDEGDTLAISKCVVDESDNPCLSPDDIDRLPMNIKQALVQATLEVNGAASGN